MANITVYNMQGQEVEKMDVSDAVFGVEINEHLVHLAVVQHLANKRQGTQKAKTRAEVSGGGRKPWRQKGTGHARQGSTRSPQWKGGGMVFAPVPRDYSFKMNKKEKANAFKSALTSRVQDNKLLVLDSLTMNEIKTKEIKKVLDALKVSKALIVTDTVDKNVTLSARNLPTVKTGHIFFTDREDGVREVKSSLNVYDILKYDTVVATKAAVKNIEEVYA